MRVKVGHRAYRVVREKRDGLDGECDHGLGVVAIDPELIGEMYQEILLHELMHCIWHMWGLGKTVSEERAATVFSHALLTLFKDNPNLLDELK
ncbi:MAG: hypothetical protein AB7P50_22145 [Alphaproteobacteria bacterium]